MADPGSIISLLGMAATLTKSVLEYASDVKDAPKELEELICELAKLHSVVEELAGKLVERGESRAENAGSCVLLTATGDLVITMEKVRAKLEKRRIATGLERVYGRLKWPFDGPEIQKLLRSIQRDAQVLHFALATKDRGTLAQVAKQGSETLITTQGPAKHAEYLNDRISQKQSEIYQSILALPDHTEMMAELKKLRWQLADSQKPQLGEVQDLLQQLSPLDFTAMQTESYKKRYGTTCQWLLDSADFPTWLQSGGGQNSVLWYQGNPGVGKTVITSIAVNHVTENIGDQMHAVVYIYCHYANSITFAADNLLGSILRQLVEQTSHAKTVAELKSFLENPAKNRRMTKDDSSSWIESLSRNFDVVYIFVDALDECPENDRDEMLRRLQQYSLGNVRVFLTSRSNVDVKSPIPYAKKVVIAAASEDITTYVESKIQRSGRLSRLTTRDPGLKLHIINTICSQANGMFLLARLQVEGLGYQTSARAVRSALESLPTDFFAIYEQAIVRIRGQPEGDAELGWKVLSMVFGARRPLSINELRHALAIKPGDTHLDSEALADFETLFSVTAGLVTTYRDKYEPESFRFVHYTLQEYFESNRDRLFPDLDLIMARVCLSYLSLDDFGSKNSSMDESINGEPLAYELIRKRLKDFCFLEYASNHWARHLVTVQTELMDQSLAFVQDHVKTAAWLRYFEYRGMSELSLYTDESLSSDPAFLAAHFHLSELFKRLISTRDINIRNHRGETPLIRATAVQPWQKGWRVGSPELNFRDERTWRRGAEPWFVRSLDTDQHAMVQVILDLSADIDAKDSVGTTAALRAVHNNNGGILSLLLDRGVSIDARMKNGSSLLHVAAKNEATLDTLQLLLDRSANPNAFTRNGKSVVHVAAEHGYPTILNRLVDHGAHLDVADKAGVTPLLVAARQLIPETLIALIHNGARLDVTDCNGMTPLHVAVSSRSPKAVRVLLRTQNINVQDTRGRTPLHHAYFESARLTDSPSKPRRAEIADVLRELIEAGASETIADFNERIPKDYSNL